MAVVQGTKSATAASPCSTPPCASPSPPTLPTCPPLPSSLTPLAAMEGTRGIEPCPHADAWAHAAAQLGPRLDLRQADFNVPTSLAASFFDPAPEVRELWPAPKRLRLADLVPVPSLLQRQQNGPPGDGHSQRSTLDIVSASAASDVGVQVCTRTFSDTATNTGSLNEMMPVYSSPRCGNYVDSASTPCPSSR